MADGVVANLHYGGEYLQQLQENARTGKCRFCEEAKNQSIRILSRDGWWVKVNPFPPKSGYPLGKPIQIPATAAYLIIAERHVMPVERLTSADWATVGALFEAIWERESLPGGIVGMRFGHPMHSGTTVIHRHFHVIVPPKFPEGMAQPDPEKPLLVVPVPFWAG